MGDDLTVVETAEALGTSPQTVRTLLRNGELRGDKRAWGQRYVWEVRRDAVDEFLAAYGRLDGHRRPGRSFPTVPIVSFVPDPVDRRPFVLRPRGRATVVVVVLGVPMVLAYLAARFLPGAWWFQELGQDDVYSRVLAAKVELAFVVGATAALVVGANLAVALRESALLRSRAGLWGVVAISLVTGSIFGSSATGHWQTFLLWQHRQSFGTTDPLHGKDIGYFVFTLPFELVIFGWLVWLAVVVVGYVAIIGGIRGTLRLRPLRVTVPVQIHLACLAATLLLLLAWRLQLQRYLLEVGQPSARVGNSFAGAGFVDMRVGLPGLTVLLSLTVVLAVACVAAPIIAASGRRRGAQLAVVIPAGLLVVAAVLVGAIVPPLVQRYVVDPNPLLSRESLSRPAPSRHPGPGSGSTRSRSSPTRRTGRSTAADFAGVRASASPGPDLGQLRARRPHASARHRAALLQPARPAARHREARLR